VCNCQECNHGSRLSKHRLLPTSLIEIPRAAASNLNLHHPCLSTVTKYSTFVRSPQAYLKRFNNCCTCTPTVSYRTGHWKSCPQTHQGCVQVCMSLRPTIWKNSKWCATNPFNEPGPAPGATMRHKGIYDPPSPLPFPLLALFPLAPLTILTIWRRHYFFPWPQWRALVYRQPK
jgi:hypothetical protein